MSHHLIAKSGIGQPWILKKLKRLSKLFLSIMIAPILLFLVTLLSGCTTIQKEYVPVKHIAIPAHLTADCLLPYIPEQMTWGESLMLNISLLSVIEQCNSDKKAIREIEQQRASK
ncbi:peptidase [Proteus mirabilis]|uniref:Rz1-like lysis system protein LysC n=1 Tax=Proteus mirabilis TaxID=584 RepID=UPI0034DD463A